MSQLGFSALELSQSQDLESDVAASETDHKEQGVSPNTNSNDKAVISEEDVAAAKEKQEKKDSSSRILIPQCLGGWVGVSCLW